MAGSAECRSQNGAFVFAKQFLDPSQRDRIDVPCVAGDVGHLLHPAIMRRMESVVHAGGQSQRHVPAIAVLFDKTAVTHQIVQRVRKALDLMHGGLSDRAAGADDGVTRAYENLRARVDRPFAVLEFADEAVVHASEMRFFRFAEVQIRKKAPQCNGQIANEWLLDLAEPADELRGQSARNTVGQQKVQILLREQPQNLRSHRHNTVISLTYSLFRSY